MEREELLGIAAANQELFEEQFALFEKAPESLTNSWQQLFSDLPIHLELYYRRAETWNVDNGLRLNDRRELSHGSHSKFQPEGGIDQGSSKETLSFPSPGREEDSLPLRIERTLQLYRRFGHLAAFVNPIATTLPTVPEELSPSFVGWSEEELFRTIPEKKGFNLKRWKNGKELLDLLKKLYCGHVGYEFSHIEDDRVQRFCFETIEGSDEWCELSLEQKRKILHHLNRSELFEHFLHTKYVGQKRFSLEGAETLIPMIAMVIEEGGKLGVEEFILGMAHRGRLNVLSNILQKSYGEIFSEFEDSYIPDSYEGSGDVKYHKGFSSRYTIDQGKELQVALMPNPSHLEAVNPIVEGYVRARQVSLGDDLEHKRVLPILIHGDAAVAGQGVIYETMQMSGLAGYANGGTIHIIINNQIGFTTLPKDSRSTRYCSDIAKSFNAPVFHLNGEDPEMAVACTLLAISLRQRFGCDVFLDLNCYRKFGHNESDEPAFTQPLEYALIRQKQSMRELYRDRLISQGVMEKSMALLLEEDFRQALKQELVKGIQGNSKKKEKRAKFNLDVTTAVPEESLRTLAHSFCHIPEDFAAHRKLVSLMSQRLAMVKELSSAIDWGMAEHLAMASLLEEGIHVRLAGQDSRRGTFSHRHAMWMDQEKERKYFPLNHLSTTQGRFDVFNSPLSEYAALGFEYGYSIAFASQGERALILWEAQFGDFCNGAQIIIDQFLSTAEQKWGQESGLVLLLPHGYEGQGPEHSSARMERFLLLAGEDNMVITYPTTPAQIFHLLRRQALYPSPKKPLIVFTPKSLLRHRSCISPLQTFVDGSFQSLIAEPVVEARRLLFCSGKIYYDLIDWRKEANDETTAIIRIEQLYPFDRKKCKELIDGFEMTKECVWVQEEPKNMGAWSFIAQHLHPILPAGCDFGYVGRKASASPAGGSFRRHQKELMEMKQELFQMVQG